MESCKLHASKYVMEERGLTGYKWSRRVLWLLVKGVNTVHMWINKNTQCITHIGTKLVKMMLSSKKAHKAEIKVLTTTQNAKNSISLIKLVKTVHLHMLLPGLPAINESITWHFLVIPWTTHHNQLPLSTKIA